jgi:antitoxin YefM
MTGRIPDATGCASPAALTRFLIPDCRVRADLALSNQRGYDGLVTVATKDAGRKLNQLIADTSRSHRPILITGEKQNAILLSEQDWRAVEETLYLLSIPGMRESIRTGMKTPVKKCLKTIRW